MAADLPATTKPLPKDFQDFTLFLDWALAKERERTQKRLASTMDEIRAFYDAMLARMDAILAYLKQFPPDHMPVEAQTVFQLSLSLIEVANAVELYKQPRLPIGIDPARFIPIE